MAKALGVVAAGSKHTASAGAEVLRAGGNAVDAVVAACLATSAGEPPLTSLAGSGVMILCPAGSSEVSVCDFNANGPGLGASRPASLDFLPVELQFGPARQVFHIGRAAAAVPGALPGLMTALERWGRLTPKDVIRPACRMLRQGVILDGFQAECFQLLAPILLHTDSGRRLFGQRGKVMAAGDRFVNPAQADTLERLATDDWRRFHREEIVPAILESVGTDVGGLITQEDLEGYRVEVRKPLRRQYRGCEVYLAPRPGVGGTLIGLYLALLESTRLGEDRHGEARHLRRLCAAMRIVEAARGQPGDHLAPKALARQRLRFAKLADGDQGPAIGGGFTTHVSAIDAEGCVAAATLSHGEGCGHLVGHTGILMNNMMGEADLHPRGFHTWPPGTRLASMMSPTLLRDADGGVTVLGTGGSSRIRTAITQVVSNLVDFGMEPMNAVRAGRIHWEGGVLNAELFRLSGGREAVEALLGEGERLVVFDRPHLFFGGVHTARRDADGRLSGGGDPRRGGVVMKA